ncbi:MAG: carboxymuconolactone decarboxylase family protein [Acidobacteriota bacterium]|nr:carboxymuconolactone decarboxylase family protein [Acidobacteriota bacterium]
MSDSKAEKGLETIQKLFGDAAGGNPMPEVLRRHTLEHLFGDVWQGQDLALEERSLVTCAVLIALGREPEQRIHFVGARNLGIPRAKIEATIDHIAHYAGWPVAVGASRSLAEVWPEESK